MTSGPDTSARRDARRGAAATSAAFAAFAVGAFVNGGFEDGPTGWTQSSSGGYELVEGQFAIDDVMTG